MKNNRFFVFLLIVLIALGMAACTRSASDEPTEEEGQFPGPEVTQDTMGTLGIYATQTAVAASEEGGQNSETSDEMPTEEPAAPTEESAEPQPVEAKPEPKPTKEKSTVKESYPVPKKYTLQKGEFPYCIARRFDISPADLLAANGLTSGSVTYPGNVLTIPQDAHGFDVGARALRAHPATYTVQAGDTVNSIACLFGDVDPRAIEDANGFSGAYSLNVGQKIDIP